MTKFQLIFRSKPVTFMGYSSIPGELLPYMGYMGMYRPKGYGFSVVLVIDSVSILVINRVWFLHSSVSNSWSGHT